MQSLTTCLMFVGDQHGRADEAMNLYVSVFEESRVIEVERFGTGQGETEGTIKRAQFTLAGREFIAMDSGAEHAFTFTPAISIFADFDREEQLDGAYAKLSEGGPC